MSNESNFGSTQPEDVESQENTEFPPEVESAIQLVTDAEAKQALETYRDAVLDFVRQKRERPEMTMDEINTLKSESQAALSALEEHKDKPGVSYATLAILYGEMGLG